MLQQSVQPPAWAAEVCASPTTYVWQYWDEDICASTSANVDLDLGYRSTSYSDYCFYLSSRP